MDPSKKDKRRKKPFRFFGIDDEIFDRFFDERFLEDLERMAEELFKMLTNAEPGRPIVRGFRLTIGPDGKPRLEEFGNKAIETPDGESIVTDEIEPLTDIIEGEDEIAITMEIPGVEKKDIDIEVTEDAVEIKVNNPRKRYHKRIQLPCKVKPKTTKATYKNGVLDIVIRRKERKKEKGAYRVNIE